MLSTRPVLLSLWTYVSQHWVLFHGPDQSPDKHSAPLPNSAEDVVHHPQSGPAAVQPFIPAPVNAEQYDVALTVVGPDARTPLAGSLARPLIAAEVLAPNRRQPTDMDACPLEEQL